MTEKKNPTEDSEAAENQVAFILSTSDSWKRERGELRIREADILKGSWTLEVRKRPYIHFPEATSFGLRMKDWYWKMELYTEGGY